LQKLINYNPYGRKKGLPKYKNLILTVKYLEHINREEISNYNYILGMFVDFISKSNLIKLKILKL
jgi:hypothetical protein